MAVPQWAVEAAAVVARVGVGGGILGGDGVGGRLCGHRSGQGGQERWVQQ